MNTIVIFYTWFDVVIESQKLLQNGQDCYVTGRIYMESAGFSQNRKGFIGIRRIVMESVGFEFNLNDFHLSDTGIDVSLVWL